MIQLKQDHFWESFVALLLGILFLYDLFLQSSSDLEKNRFFRIIYENLSDPLFSYLLKITGNQSTAEDILQETFYLSDHK